MLYEMTSQDLKTEFYPFQDVFVGSSRGEISPSEILERWFLNFRGKPFEKPFFAIPNLLSILQVDYSSSIYQFLKSKSETALTEDFFRKVEQIKVLEDVSGMLNELTSEQMEIFEEVVKRRPLFK